MKRTHLGQLLAEITDSRMEGELFEVVMRILSIDVYLVRWVIIVGLRGFTFVHHRIAVILVAACVSFCVSAQGVKVVNDCEMCTDVIGGL